jgi:glycosyltransferase involved in cell wall biosynthesis
MAPPPVYLLFPTTHIGGAEKRLLGFVEHELARGNDRIQLVVSHELFAHAEQMQEIPRVLAREHDPASERLRFSGARIRKELPALLSWLHARDPKAIFHYVLATPLEYQRFVSRRTVLTLPMSTLRLYNRNGVIGVIGGALLAGRTDFLSPTVRDECGRLLAPVRDRLRITPGSFVDTETYAPRPFAERENRLVFLGIFLEAKQAQRLAGCMDGLLRALRKEGLDPSASFLGRDAPGERSVTEQLAALQPEVVVETGYHPNPSAIMASSKVFFSVQRDENYPSKSLLEAMACGLIPIVTDVGLSRQIASPDFAFFIPADFTVDDLLGPVRTILTMDESTYTARVTAMRAFLQRRFSIEVMASYYRGLYDEVDK